MVVLNGQVASGSVGLPNLERRAHGDKGWLLELLWDIQRRTYEVHLDDKSTRVGVVKIRD